MIHEVVGPVQRAAPDRLTVLGQSVVTAGLPPEMPRPRVGERVAVSGLRRPDGSIAASRIDPAGSAPDLVAGPVRRGPAGALRIGNLPLAGLDPALAGGRAVAEGSLTGGRLAVARAVPASEPFGAEARRLSIEAYVTREGGGFRTGAGYAVTGGGGLVPAGGGLAILDGRTGRGGRIDLDGLRLRPDPAGRETGRDVSPAGPARVGPVPRARPTSAPAAGTGARAGGPAAPAASGPSAVARADAPAAARSTCGCRVPKDRAASAARAASGGRADPAGSVVRVARGPVGASAGEASAEEASVAAASVAAASGEEVREGASAAAGGAEAESAARLTLVRRSTGAQKTPILCLPCHTAPRNSAVFGGVNGQVRPRNGQVSSRRI